MLGVGTASERTTRLVESALRENAEDAGRAEAASRRTEDMIEGERNVEDGQPE